jgi:hypothetical protein
MEQLYHIRDFKETLNESFEEESADWEKIIIYSQPKNPVETRIINQTKIISSLVVRNCKRCQYPNSEDAWYCCRCGALLMKYWECTQCFQKNPQETEVCGQCGCHKESP